MGIHPEHNVLRILRGSHPKALMLAEITRRMIDRAAMPRGWLKTVRQKGFPSGHLQKQPPSGRHYHYDQRP